MLAADIALTKLSVIIAKLTHLKSAAALQRKKAIVKAQISEVSPSRTRHSLFVGVEERIKQQVMELQDESEYWHRRLPIWFGSLLSDQMNDGEEDINQSEIVEVQPEQYSHHSIAVVLNCAFAANIQLWRVGNPEETKPPPRIGALCHAIFRAFLAIPASADSTIFPNIWVAALLLRNDYHRNWLEAQVRRRIKETDFFGWKFAYHGILHEWSSVDGKERTFKSIPVWAKEVVPGVSENLWRADGIMNTKISDMIREDEEEEKAVYRFAGDTSLYFVGDQDVSDTQQ